jgi:hypothetical protein
MNKYLYRYQAKENIKEYKKIKIYKLKFWKKDKRF